MTQPAHRRPERRNRNIGREGFGKRRDGDMRIPESWTDRFGNVNSFYERMDAAKVCEAVVGKKTLKVIYESPRMGFSYGMSPSDLIVMLKACVVSMPTLPYLFVFRQPTRNEQQLSPVWGRFIYRASIGSDFNAAIILEAQELGKEVRWPRRLSVEDQAELARLESDGFRVKPEKRDFVFRVEAEPLRNIMLYRTLLHELGHWQQYWQDVLDPATALFRDNDRAFEAHISRAVREREEFAHQFAARMRTHLTAEGVLPIKQTQVEDDSECDLF